MSESSENKWESGANDSNEINQHNSIKISHKNTSKNSEASSHHSIHNQNEGINFLENIQKQNKENSRRKSSGINDNVEENKKKIIEKIILAYTKMKGDERSETFQAILNNQDLYEILKELSRNDKEDIVVYILSEFFFESKKEGFDENLFANEGKGKEEKFKDLYFLAIKKGQIRILEALNKQELNFNKFLDSEGNTGLILAVINSNIQMAKFFLKYYHEMIEKKNNHNHTPLLLSVYNNDNLMFFLLANNIDNPITGENSLYELAIRNENLDIINYLNSYKNKKIFNFKPSRLLLHYAVCQSSLEVFKTIADILKEYDYKIQTTLETPLHWAAMKGNYYIVKELLKLYKENQIEIDQKNCYGVTPFMLANLRQDKYICELFYENVADINHQDNEGNSIVHLMAALGDVKWINFMIKKFNVNCYLINNHGNTPFIEAILNENIECVQFFIRMFCNNKNPQFAISNINWKNKYGQTPLHAAVFTGNIKIIKILLENKADIAAIDANELTPYHYAYINEKKDVVDTIHETLKVK